MFKPNYKKKAQVLTLGLDRLERKRSKYLYCQYQVDKALALNGEILENHCKLDDDDKILIDYYMEEEKDLFNEAKKVNHASYVRNQRLQQRIASYLKLGSCIFLTLTFTDKVLENTTKETRKKYVINQLKKISSKYVANIDYGSINEREHYHAIVLCDKVNRELWPYGAINFERIKVNNKSSDIKLAKYITKLTNHAIKDTCQKNNIIYSRI